MSTPTKAKNLKNSFEDLFKPRSEESEVKHDALMLMAGFLSEIEAIQDERKISKGDLAQKIGTSASYITQVFRSNKPLNFITLAKIKRALDLRFEIRAFQNNAPSPIESNTEEYSQISLAKFAQDSLANIHDTIPSSGSFFNMDCFQINASSTSKDVSQNERVSQSQISVNRTLV